MADNKCLEYYMEQYKRGKMCEEDVWRLFHTLRWRNKDMFDYFYLSLNEKYPGKFKIDPQPDWEQIRNERSQKDFELLFSKNSFIKEIEFIFDQEHRESLTRMNCFGSDQMTGHRSVILFLLQTPLEEYLKKVVLPPNKQLKRSINLIGNGLPLLIFMKKSEITNN